MKMLRTLRMLLLMLLPPPRPPFTLPLFGSVQRGAVDQSEHLAASQAARGRGGRVCMCLCVHARVRACVQDVVCPLRAANRLMRPVRELHINTNSPDTASRRPTNINFSF